MKMVFAGIWIVSLLLGSVVPRDGMAQTQPATAAVPQDQDVQATREQVREIQFMLLRLGLDPTGRTARTRPPNAPFVHRRLGRDIHCCCALSS